MGVFNFRPRARIFFSSSFLELKFSDLEDSGIKNEFKKVVQLSKLNRIGSHPTGLAWEIWSNFFHPKKWLLVVEEIRQTHQLRLVADPISSRVSYMSGGDRQISEPSTTYSH